MTDPLSPSRTPAELLAELEPHIADRRVLAAIAAVPRNLFVPPRLRARAWENVALPIGERQTISQPLVVARMCELLELSGTERVLDVGTGSGYHAAVLGLLGRSVLSIERHRSLSEQAARNLEAAQISRVTLVVGDGSRGHPDAAPYDAINVAAAADELPAQLVEQLAPLGRIVAPTGGRDGRLVLTRRTDGALRCTAFEPVRFVPLISDQRTPTDAGASDVPTHHAG